MLDITDKDQKWASISAQSSLLGVSFLLISQKIVNSYILLSISLIFSLFILQATKNRYLLFKPFNDHVLVPTVHVDTIILWLFTFLAGGFLLLGVTFEYNFEVLKEPNDYLKSKLLWIFLFIDIVFPLCSATFGGKLITKSLAKRLMEKSYRYKCKCDVCNADDADCENVVIDWDDLRIRMTCKSCDIEKEIKTKRRLG